MSFEYLDSRFLTIDSVVRNQDSYLIFFQAHVISEKLASWQSFTGGTHLLQNDERNRNIAASKA